MGYGDAKAADDGCGRCEKSRARSGVRDDISFENSRAAGRGQLHTLVAQRSTHGRVGPGTCVSVFDINYLQLLS